MQMRRKKDGMMKAPCEHQGQVSSEEFDGHDLIRPRSKSKKRKAEVVPRKHGGKKEPSSSKRVHPAEKRDAA